VTSDPTQPLPDFARFWARELGAKESTLVQLKGGINNRVYRCGDLHFWVIKGYEPLKPGLRDRMQAEVEFLQYSVQVAPEFTPSLIHVDAGHRCVVMEHVDGEAFQEGVPPPPLAIDYAVDFFKRLNADFAIARQTIRQNAAEGFLGLAEHLENIHQRLAGMTCDHIHAEIKPQAELLLASLRYRFKIISEKTVNEIVSGKLNDTIQPEDCCISPSDFGFHNAILSRGGVRFIDFEFSGWDDPAKAAIDFILQPRIPLKQGTSPLLASMNPEQYNNIKKRYETLLPILSLKWICIILSVLNPDRLGDMMRIYPSNQLRSLISERINCAGSYLKTHSIRLFDPV